MKLRTFGVCVGLLAVRVWLAAASAAAQPVSAREQPALRGITIGPIESSQQPGRGYGTLHSAELLDELVRLGANAVSITPFGRLWSLQSTEILLDFEAPYPENRAAVSAMIRQAKERGLQVLVIPHLWVETGGWRGEIDPGSEEGWQRYQASYRRFVLAWAQDAQRAGADAFSIGVECKSWSGRFGEFWSGLIAELRATFRGKLTYSANWDEADDVGFWDQLDWVGVNAFYPLASADGASDAEYQRGAADALDKLRVLSETVQKPAVLIEIGYTTRANAAVQPWLWPDDMQNVVIDEREQARALAALAGAAASSELVHGLFVWRYYANLDDVSQEAIWGFSPHGKLAEPVLERIFSLPWAADPLRAPWEPVPLAPREQWPELRWELKNSDSHEGGKAGRQK